MTNPSLQTKEGVYALPPTAASVASTNARPRKPASKTTPFKVHWLNQIAADGSLPRMALRVAIRLFDYYDEEKGYAWPSQIRLAARLKASRSGVRQGIERLEKAGYIEFVSTRGRKQNTHYFLRCPAPENGY